MILGGEWGGEWIGVWTSEQQGVFGPTWFKGWTTSYKVVSTSSSKYPTNTESSNIGRSFFLYSLLGKSGIIGNPPIFFTYSLVCLLRPFITWLSTANKFSLFSWVFGSGQNSFKIITGGVISRKRVSSASHALVTLLLVIETIEAWKFVGNNSKGFSPVNVPN